MFKRHLTKITLQLLKRFEITTSLKSFSHTGKLTIEPFIPDLKIIIFTNDKIVLEQKLKAIKPTNDNKFQTYKEI
jgi:hypothetical protein